MNSKIGFVGPGKMSMPMAKNILRADFQLTVYNRSGPPVQELVKNGANGAASPELVGLRSDIVFLSLPSPEIVKDAIFGKNGLIRGLRKCATVVDTSTVDPASARDIALKLGKRDIHFLDTPVSGGPKGAEKGTLTFMVGGESSVLERCRDVMETMGKNIFHMGESGAGQATKLVNQILVSIRTVAAAEATIFAESLGLDLDKVARVIQVSAGDSFVFRRTAPIMASRNFGSGGWQIYLLRMDP